MKKDKAKIYPCLRDRQKIFLTKEMSKILDKIKKNPDMKNFRCEFFQVMDEKEKWVFKIGRYE